MSEHAVGERWGSHWRWRWLLTAWLFVLLACAYVLAEQWIVRRLVPSNSPPAVVRVVRRTADVLEAFDWTTGKRFEIARASHDGRNGETDQIVAGGAVVAWQRGTVLHVVDIMPPHQERLFNIPLGSPGQRLLGLSADANYAVYQLQTQQQLNLDGSKSFGTPPAGTYVIRPIWVVTIVRLATQEISETREWESSLAADWGAGGFTSTRSNTPPLFPAEPAFAHWSISSEGKLQRIDSAGAQPLANILAAQNANGEWRLPENSASVRADETAVQFEVVKWTPSGMRFLASEPATQVTFFVDVESKVIRPLDVLGQRFTQAGFIDDETIVLSDLRDDIRVIDAGSGKLIAWESSGSVRHGSLALVAIALTLTCAMWFWLALRERSLFWGVADSLLVCVTIQLSAGAVLTAWHHPDMPTAQNIWFTTIQCSLSVFVAASNAGAATAIGWYWSHGRGWLLGRWLRGLVWLFISAIPTAVLALFVEMGSDPLAMLEAFVVFNILLSSLTSFIVAGPRLLGWTIDNAPLNERPNRFGLAAFMAVVGGIALLIPMVQWFYSDVQEQMVVVTGMAMGAGVAGIALVSMLFSRARWYVRTLAWMLLMAAMATWVIALPHFFAWGVPSWFFYVAGSSAIASVAFAVAIPCLVLRAHGWHWVRVRKPAGSLETAPNVVAT